MVDKSVSNLLQETSRDLSQLLCPELLSLYYLPTLLPFKVCLKFAVLSVPQIPHNLQLIWLP